MKESEGERGKGRERERRKERVRERRKAKETKTRERERERGRDRPLTEISSRLAGHRVPSRVPRHILRRGTSPRHVRHVHGSRGAVQRFRNGRGGGRPRDVWRACVGTPTSLHPKRSTRTRTLHGVMALGYAWQPRPHTCRGTSIIRIYPPA